MGRVRHHVFVCVNRRPSQGRPSCAARGGERVLAALQRALATSAALCGEAAATGCGCLGPCFDGPNMVVYPEGVWYAGVTPEDIPDVVRDHLIGGVPVARLRYHWPDDDLDDNGDSDDDDDDDRR